MLLNSTSPFSKAFLSLALLQGRSVHTSLQCGALFQHLTNLKLLSQGLQLHSYTITTAFLLQNIYLSTKIASFYGSCGRMLDARKLFEEIPIKNSFLWNSMIRGYACSGFPDEALKLFANMLESKHSPDKFTFPFVLKACGDTDSTMIGRASHGQVILYGFAHDVYICNSLLSMYGKLGDTNVAMFILRRMGKLRDSTSWNTLISSLVKNGKLRESLSTFQAMRRSGLAPDAITFLGLISCLARLPSIDLGKQVHSYLIRTGNNTLSTENALMEMYSRCGAMRYARRVFASMENRDTISWNTLIETGSSLGESVEIYREMVRGKWEPDEVTFIIILRSCGEAADWRVGSSIHGGVKKMGMNSWNIVGTGLISMYGKCGNIESCVEVFKRVERRTIVTYGAMINAYGMNGKGKEATGLLEEMVGRGMKADGGAVVSALAACSHGGMVEEGKRVVKRMREEWGMSLRRDHYVCLVDMLGRGGHLEAAYRLIERMGDNDHHASAAFIHACRLHQDLPMANRFRITPNFPPGTFLCLSTIYAHHCQWDQARNVRVTARSSILLKLPASSFQNS